MEGYLLQDWITIKADPVTSFVAQSEEGWLDLLDYRDIVFWLEVEWRNRGGAGGVSMRYETSPTKDEALFSPMVAAFDLSATTTPDIKKVIEALNPTLPVCRWVRWRIEATTPGPSSEWGATFRIHCSVNRCWGP